jgi:hypothetical protein
MDAQTNYYYADGYWPYSVTGNITTISFWVRHDGADWYTFMSLDDGTYEVSAILNPGNDHMLTKHSQYQPGSLSKDHSNLNANTDYNVIVTYDAVANTTTAWVNGTIHGGPGGPIVNTGSLTKRVSLGRRTDGHVQTYLGGALWDARAYRGYLSVEQRMAIYQNPGDLYRESDEDIMAVSIGAAGHAGPLINRPPVASKIQGVLVA